MNQLVLLVEIERGQNTSLRARVLFALKGVKLNVLSSFFIYTAWITTVQTKRNVLVCECDTKILFRRTKFQPKFEQNIGWKIFDSAISFPL